MNTKKVEPTMKENLTKKLEKNRKQLLVLENKKYNLEREIENLKNKISNQERALTSLSKA